MKINQTSNKYLIIFIVGLLSSATFLFLPAGKVSAAKDFYQAERLEQSYPEGVNLEPGKAITFWVKYKNVGQYRWRQEGPRQVYLKVKDDSGITKTFKHQFWLDAGTAVALKDKIIEPGGEATFKFAIQAPEEVGVYWLKFNLFAYGHWVTNGDLEVLVRVNSKNQALAKVVSQNTAADSVAGSNAGNAPVIHKTVYEIEDLQIPEPKIRVGLFNTSSTVDIIASGAYEVQDPNGQLLVLQTQGEASQIEFDFQNKRYFLNIGGQRIISSDSYFKLVPRDENSVFTIVNYSNFNNGNATNYNQFRGNLEAQWIAENERFWVINELPMEKYLRGIGEAMDISPYEYLKSMAIAERTYAMFQFLNPAKHAIRNFTVTATEADQIYQGYAREVIQPNIVRAVEETRGIVATYQKEVALTPYFSQSDGRTRSYEEVWHKTYYPYLIAVEDPHMKGQKLLGHGVGLSARGALFMASKDSANFEDILYHYYQGIEAKKVY